jgi:hypothetical protein
MRKEYDFSKGERGKFYKPDLELYLPIYLDQNTNVKIKYTKEPMGELRVIKDFLPPPDQLVVKEENVKVKIALKKSSIDFFKKEAKKHHTSYQKMIRQFIDWYVSHYQTAHERHENSFTPCVFRVFCG